MTGSLHLCGGDAEELARRIQQRIVSETGISCRFGISENKILAKTACDNYAKKNESGVYTLHKDRLDGTLWTLPINKLFMAGNRMTYHFRSMGIDTIGQLANTRNHVYKAAVKLLERHWDGNPVRKVGITLAQFCDSDE